MMKSTLEKEIVIKVVNDIGAMAGIAKTIAEKGIGIQAVSAWAEGINGVIHLVTDDNLRAMDVLRDKHYDAREASVVVAEVPNKPGLLEHVTRRLGEAGIDLHHLYASATAGQPTCRIVFSSSNNNHAMVVLNKEPAFARH